MTVIKVLLLIYILGVLFLLGLMWFFDKEMSHYSVTSRVVDCLKWPYILVKSIIKALKTNHHS